MRYLAKSAIATFTLLICSTLFPNTAIAQSTSQNDSAEPKTGNFVSDIVSAAEQRGVQVIIINSESQEVNSENSTPAGNGVWTGDDYDNLVDSMAPTSATNFMKVQTGLLNFRDLFKTKIEMVPPSVEKTLNEIKKNSPTNTLQPYVRVLYWSFLLLAFGAWIEREVYVKRILARWLAPNLRDNPIGYLEKVPMLIKRALLRVVGVIISMVIAFVTGSLLFREAPTETIQFTIAVVYLGYAAFRLLRILWRMILAPYLCQYRIPHFSNADAVRLYHWLWFISAINILALMMGIWLFEVGGRSDIHAVLSSLFSFVVALANILMVVFNRKALSRAIRNGRPINSVGAITKFVSNFWLLAATAYFAFSWLQLTYRVVLNKPLSTPLIAGAYGILLATICVYALANFFIERVSLRSNRLIRLKPEDHKPEEDGSEEDGPASASPGEDPHTSYNNDTNNNADDSHAVTVVYQHPLASYEDLARHVSGILAVGVGIWALTQTWNFDSLERYSNVFERSTDALAILFFGYIIYHIVRIWIDNKIQAEGGEISLAPGDEGGASSASRLATLLPLFRNFMLIVIGMSVLFSALLELGINVSPLFASAGVVGLAIGFGAQTLVRDIFSGAFYLFDDAFRRGEYVDIGSVKGTVEKISVRSFQLRHHLGPLHTIPFGEIQSLTNYSRDWVMMKLPLRLTYDTDPERVRKLVKKLGQQLMTDPEIGETFLQPLKSQGVIEMQDSAMIVRVKFMTKPGDQWTIRKRVYQEIRDLFHREGIQFANKEVTVRLAGEVPAKLDSQQAQKIAAAAVDFDEDDSPAPSGDDR